MCALLHERMQKQIAAEKMGERRTNRKDYRI